MAAKQVFVVTGANKGIGYGIVKALAEKIHGGIIYLTARNPSLGEQSLKKIVEELGEKRQSEILFHQLDISDEASCKAFADFLKQKHGHIHALINNAGFAFNQDASEPAGVQADVTVGINYYGTKRISQHLMPLIEQNGRLVNVCSQMGIMKPPNYSEALINKFNDVNNYTVSDIDSFVENYKKFAHADTRKENGYPESAYRVSKVAEIALTMLQHAQLAPTKGIVVNACCPGFVNTDMTNHKGQLTIEQGADTPVFLATDPNAPNGKFVSKRTVTEWI